MDLLHKQHLESSPIVANNRMNRERNAMGVNSYERDIWLSPQDYLTPIALQKKGVSWLDICCGQAKALIQTAQEMNRDLPNHSFNFTGIDLVDMYAPVPDQISNITLITDSFFDFQTTQHFDLITCVHGLHYLGDKLGAIQKAYSLLKSDGLFVANLDMLNLKHPSQKNFHKVVRAWFQENDLHYNTRKHLLTIKGARSLKVPFTYLGADDKAGPNYTGQEVVDSYYE